MFSLVDVRDHVLASDVLANISYARPRSLGHELNSGLTIVAGCSERLTRTAST